MTAYRFRSARAVCAAALPIDERGFLIPWFVATIDIFFHVIRAGATTTAVNERDAG